LIKRRYEKDSAVKSRAVLKGYLNKELNFLGKAIFIKRRDSRIKILEIRDFTG